MGEARQAWRCLSLALLALSPHLHTHIPLVCHGFSSVRLAFGSVCSFCKSSDYPRPYHYHPSIFDTYSGEIAFTTDGILFHLSQPCMILRDVSLTRGFILIPVFAPNSRRKSTLSTRDADPSLGITSATLPLCAFLLTN